MTSSQKGAHLSGEAVGDRSTRHRRHRLGDDAPYSIAVATHRRRTANRSDWFETKPRQDRGNVTPRDSPRPPGRFLGRGPDARATVIGLALVAPLPVAMMVGSTGFILLASVIALAASLLSPLAGLIALAFMAPFPRPLVIPTPGLYAAMTAAILLGTILRLPIERPRLRWPSSEVTLISAFLLYVAAQYIGGRLDASLSPRESNIAYLFAQMTIAILTFVAATLVLRGRSPYPILVTLLASAVFAATMAFAQSFGAEGVFGDLFPPEENVNQTAADRVTGPFLDPNYFGAYLAAGTTLAIACATVFRSSRLKLALLALAVYVGTATVLTLSRGAAVSIAAGLTTIAFTRGRKVGLITVAALLLVAVIGWPLFAGARYGAESDIASGGLGSQLENSDRTGVWLPGIDVFLSSPLFGIGWGRFVEEASSETAAHNWYIALLAETGIIGFILWVLFIASFAVALRSRPPPAQTIGYSVLVVWMVASMFLEVPMLYAATGPVLIVLAAATAADWMPLGYEADTRTMLDSHRQIQRGRMGSHSPRVRAGVRR